MVIAVQVVKNGMVVVVKCLNLRLVMIRLIQTNGVRAKV
jgi:hypothetical protein